MGQQEVRITHVAFGCVWLPATGVYVAYNSVACNLLIRESVLGTDRVPKTCFGHDVGVGTRQCDGVLCFGHGVQDNNCTPCPKQRKFWPRRICTRPCRFLFWPRRVHFRTGRSSAVGSVCLRLGKARKLYEGEFDVISYRNSDISDWFVGIIECRMDFPHVAWGCCGERAHIGEPRLPRRSLGR